MLDDFDTPLCNKKHYGPVLYIKGDVQVMRCTLCNQNFESPVLSADELEQKRKSSRTCVSICDWVTEGQTVRCSLAVISVRCQPYQTTNKCLYCFARACCKRECCSTAHLVVLGN